MVINVFAVINELFGPVANSYKPVCPGANPVNSAVSIFVVTNGPGGPVNPVWPVKPVGPVWPVIPVCPVGPVWPVNPVCPVGPV
jgi:hypothetical protein